jgi:hypothetical protein
MPKNETWHAQQAQKSGASALCFGFLGDYCEVVQIHSACERVMRARKLNLTVSAPAASTCHAGCKLALGVV